MQAFKKHLKNLLPEEWEITEELNLNWDGNSTIVILKANTGTEFINAKVIPFQIIVLTDDVPASLATLNTFIGLQHEKFFINNFNFYKQYYYTPVVPTVAISTGNTLTSQIIVTGMLTEASDISDIRKVEITYGQTTDVIYSTVRNFAYTTEGDSQIIINDNVDLLAKRNNRAGIVSFTLSFLAQGNNFCNKLRQLRLGTLDPNATFTLKFNFTDSNTPGTYAAEGYDETYTCKVVNYSYNSENSILPTYTVGFQTT